MNNAYHKQVAALVDWIVARHCIYLSKNAGNPAPWTGDEILRNYRFCNVYRELDSVTQWISNNWRTPYASEDHLWFLMTVSRLVNWPETLAQMDVRKILNWNPEYFVKVLRSRIDADKKTYGAAYIVSTNGARQPKEFYLAHHVLTPMWKNRKILMPKEGDSLNAFHERIKEHIGVGSFIGGQIVADLKNTVGTPLAEAEDWFTWACSGPGSRRGLNRILGRDLNAPWRESDWREYLMPLLKEVNDRLVSETKLPKGHFTRGFQEIHAQDLQNCLCEFDKYERTRLGQGRPRNRYNGFSQGNLI